MARRIPSGLPAEIERVARRLEAYRNRRRDQRSRRLPEGLWARAVDLARRHGVSRISRALRLEYYVLKRRLRAAGERPVEEVLPRFVEVGPFGGSAAHAIEVEDGEGRKMTVRVSGGSAGDLVALAEGLWRSRP